MRRFDCFIAGWASCYDLRARSLERHWAGGHEKKCDFDAIMAGQLFGLSVTLFAVISAIAIGRDLTR